MSQQACRHCGTPIRPSASDTYWVGADDYDHCEGTGDTHEPAEETP